MASQATIQQIIDYYVNLLIIQYHNQPKAKAMISFVISELLVKAIAFDVQDGYDLDTAVGVQLDVLGKYAGIDRFYKDLTLVDYFSLVAYSEVAGPPPTPPRYGFTDYAHYATDPPAGTLIYSDMIAGNFTLGDDAFRTLIKLKILQNNSNHSDKDIDDITFEFFGNTVWPEDMGNMHMAYFVTPESNQLIDAAIYKKLLLRPMTVGAVIVTGVTGLMFAFGDYNNYESVYGHGLTDYAHYAATAGLDLTYSQMKAY